MNRELFIMDYNRNCIGEVVFFSEEKEFKVIFDSKELITKSLPRIMQNIVPAESQKEVMDDLLNYYDMEKYDFWDFFIRSNGIKIGRNIWFMAKPPGEVYIPLFGSKQYNSWMKVGSKINFMMDGTAIVDNHKLNGLLPPVLIDHLEIGEKDYIARNVGKVLNLFSKSLFKDLQGSIKVTF